MPNNQNDVRRDMKFLFLVFFLVGIGFILGQFITINSLMNPKDPNAYVSEAYRIHESAGTNSGSIPKAIKLCEEALALDSNHAPAYRLLARIYMQRGEYIFALPNWEKFRALQPKDSDMQETIDSKIQECVRNLVISNIPSEEINSYLATNVSRLEARIETNHKKHQAALEEKDREIAFLTGEKKDLENHQVEMQQMVTQLLLLVERSESTNQKAKFLELLKKMSKTKFMRYTIKRGDTISKIAKNFGVTPESIVDLNRIENFNRISPGDIIYIPVPADRTNQQR